MAARVRVGRTGSGRGLVVVGVLAGLLAGLAGMSGCAGWDTWPPVDPVDRAPNRDDAAIGQTMTLALARVIADYPPRGNEGQAVAINLPGPLVGEAVYRRVARDVEAEPGIGRLVSPLDEAGLALPIYHVAGVRIRTSRAEIDILRPVFGAGELDRAELTNDKAYEGYTVRLSGGFRPWHVTWVERFSPGIIPAPALNLINQIEPGGLGQPLAVPAPEQMPELPVADPAGVPAAGSIDEPTNEPTDEPAEDPSGDPGPG